MSHWNIQESQVLASFVKPCKAVTSFSVSRWLKKGLSIAGIDTMMFKDHSTLVASITNVDVTVVSVVCETMKQEQWSNKSTFQKFTKKKLLIIVELFKLVS